MNKLISAWKQLALNVDQFFASKSAKLECHKGCSKCCEVERTVFGLEAHIILEHLQALTPHFKEELRTALTASNRNPNHCAFLKDGACLIYPVRPLICRSHGLVHLSEHGPHHCELNFKAGLPDRADWIDETRLTTLLALLQRQFTTDDGQGEEARVSLHQVALEFLAPPSK